MEAAYTQKTVTMIPAVSTYMEKDIRKRHLRVAAYCRVSTDNEEQLSSYNSQIEYYTTKISENPNWTIAGIFADEGLSGTSTKKREQFNRMIEKCRRGRIDLILTKSISRFARNTLDCICYVRKLKALGVGIVFEKEGVNTLEIDDETMLTMLGSFAQAESESLSKNVRMGFRQSFKAGRVPFHYQGFLGYRKGADGNPEIVPEEAEIVRRIFHRFLAGQSVAAIKKDLELDGIPSPRGKATWSVGVLQYMLHNERYIGDALLQKTFVTDVLTKKNKKNNGEQPKSYVHNNHPAIIDRDTFHKVQEEIARRASKRTCSTKQTKTPLARYSGLYALNELLVCGDCGTPYRRVSWTRKNGKKIVWRCLNRLENGPTRCKTSPTLEENRLHKAIMSALSEMISRKPLMEALRNSVEAAVSLDQDAVEYYSAKRRIKELDEMMMTLVKYSAKAGTDEEFYNAKFKAIADEQAEIRAAVQQVETSRAADGSLERRVNEACALLADEKLVLSEFNDHYVKQLIDTVKVMSEDRLIIVFKGGFEVEQTVAE